MMLHTQMFIPLYFQLKLHIDAQIGSNVPASRKQLAHLETSSLGDNSIFLVAQIIEGFYLGKKHYGFLSYCT